jgi:hypothetical protein
MRQQLIALAISIIMLSCGGGGGQDDPPVPPPPANRTPGTPTLTSPADQLLCLENTVQFEWSAATDPDGDPISYELQVATDTQFSQNLTTRNTTATSVNITLEKGIAYYWRVRAVDSRNAAGNYSSVFSFYTEGDGLVNHLPYAPILVSPALNSVVQTSSTTLEWTADDVDDDTLSFTVYFGTSNPPTQKLAEDQSASTLNASLEASRDYYWYVVVKDGQGGITKGQVWKFKTD